MKKLIQLSIYLLLATMVVSGQNYIGLSESKIVKKFGQPDEKGTNYIVYYDQNEEGTNTYYFDEDRVCVSFVISRKADYFEGYTKLLNKDFTKTLDNTYVSKSKKWNYQAEVTKSTKDFQIRIISSEKSVDAFDNQREVSLNSSNI
jgi:hypothetical protein